jgi:hypothetical protein
MPARAGIIGMSWRPWMSWRNDFGLSDHLHGDFDSVDGSRHHLPHHWSPNDPIF